MYIFRGGQLVEEGIYWESEKNERVVMKASGFLPGVDNKVYLKLPDSYLLVPVLLLGLALSMIFPYGIGLAIFAFICLLHNILFSFVTACEDLFEGILAHITVAYKPHLSYFSGSSKKLKRRKKRETGAE
jgi:hypothetical protein